MAIFLVVSDTDDTEHLDGTATRTVVDTSFELDFTVDVDDIAVKIVEDVLYLLAFQRNGVATPFSEFSRCSGFPLGLSRVRNQPPLASTKSVVR